MHSVKAVTEILLAAIDELFNAATIDYAAIFI